jgi:competence CoiA-like predicted nuclease
MNAEIEGWEIEKRIEGFIVDDYRIADCFKKNNVIELQKSSISDKEILHRNIFYNAHNFNIHWVFDFTDKEELFLNFYNDTDLGFKQNHPRKSILILFNYIPSQNKPIWGNVFLQIGEDEYIQVKKMYTDEEGRGNGNGWGKIVNQKQMFKLCSMRTKR